MQTGNADQGLGRWLFDQARCVPPVVILDPTLDLRPVVYPGAR